MAKRTKATPRRAKKEWQDKFLAELAVSSNVSQSAKKAGVDASTVYKTRRTDAVFNRRWQEALAEGYDNLEMELVRRLRIGELTGGGPAKARRKFDNGIAFRLLAAHREAAGRQRAHRANEDEDAILASLDAKLERMHRRQLAREARERQAAAANDDERAAPNRDDAGE